MDKADTILKMANFLVDNISVKLDSPKFRCQIPKTTKIEEKIIIVDRINYGSSELKPTRDRIPCLSSSLTIDSSPLFVSYYRF